MQVQAPDLDSIHAAYKILAPFLVRTPSLDWPECPALHGATPPARVNLKYELFQHGGSFKARGALNVMQSLSKMQREAGVVAASGGNHAVAVAWCAQRQPLNATVFMPASASALRQSRCKAYGADVRLTADLASAFAAAQEMQEKSGKVFIHPFEGPLTSIGNATLGLEWLSQEPDLEALIIPVGGGGLISGIAAAAKQINPAIKVFGVEPEGAPTLLESLRAGSPQKLAGVRTIADSLAAPYALPYSFGLIQQYVDEIVLVDDLAIRRAQRLLFDAVKIVAEPATAISLAALLGPLAFACSGLKTGVLLCGSNIDADSFYRQISEIADA